MRQLTKVVRDNIDQYLDAEPGGMEAHNRITYQPVVSRPEDELRKKLMEEVAEYMVTPSAGELADIIEACHALAVRDLGIEPQEVERIRLRKRAERGGFTHVMGMFVGD